MRVALRLEWPDLARLPRLVFLTLQLLWILFAFPLTGETGSTRTHSVRAAKDGSEYRIHAPRPINHTVRIHYRGSAPGIVHLSRLGEPDVTRSSTLLSGMLSGLTTDQEKALAIWNYLRKTRLHADPPEPLSEETSNPIRLLGIYGYGICGNWSGALATLAREAGLEARIWNLGGHTVPEVRWDGKWHMLDPDHRTYYEDENGEILSVEGAAARPDLVSARRNQSVAEIFATTDNNRILTLPLDTRHDLRPQYHPDDTVEFDFSFAGIVYARPGFKEGRNPPSTFGNGRLFRNVATAIPHRLNWPYPIVNIELHGESSSLELSVDGETFERVSCPDVADWIASQNQAIYELFLRVDAGKDTRAPIIATFQFAPTNAVQLRHGHNTFAVHIDGPPNGVVDVSHEYSLAPPRKKRGDRNRSPL